MQWLLRTLVSPDKSKGEPPVDVPKHAKERRMSVKVWTARVGYILKCRSNGIRYMWYMSAGGTRYWMSGTMAERVGSQWSVNERGEELQLSQLYVSTYSTIV